MHYFRKECESYVKGFPGARYKKFSTEDEAKSFVSGLKSSGSLTSAVAAPSVSVDKLINGWFTRRSYVVYFNCILLNVRISWETHKPGPARWSLTLSLQSSHFFNSPYCLLYNSHDDISENLILEQVIIS